MTRFLQGLAKGLILEEFLIECLREAEGRVVPNGPSSCDDRSHALSDQFARDAGGQLIVGRAADLPEVATIEEDQFRNRIQHGNFRRSEKQAVVEDNAGLRPGRLDVCLAVIAMSGDVDDAIGLSKELVQDLKGAEPLTGVVHCIVGFQ